MFPLPTFILDVSPYLLLNTRKNSDISFFHIEVKARRWPRRYFKHGETGISSEKSAFPQYPLRLNPHSATAILSDPRFVQQGVEVDNLDTVY